MSLGFSSRAQLMANGQRKPAARNEAEHASGQADGMQWHGDRDEDARESAASDGDAGDRGGTPQYDAEQDESDRDSTAG
jgi:hypothetical protein